MNEKWNEVKERVLSHGESYPYPDGYDTVIESMLSRGDKGSDDVKDSMVRSLKALCKTVENNPFSTRKPLPPIVIESLKIIEESLIAFYEHIWESNSRLFPIIEPPHGKSKLLAFDTMEQWVEVKLVAYRKRLVAYYNSGMWDGTLLKD